MNKSQITKAARECGYDSHYDGKTKTFHLSRISIAKNLIGLKGMIKKAGFLVSISRP